SRAGCCRTCATSERTRGSLSLRRTNTDAVPANSAQRAKYSGGGDLAGSKTLFHLLEYGIRRLLCPWIRRAASKADSQRTAGKRTAGLAGRRSPPAESLFDRSPAPRDRYSVCIQ